MLSGLRRIWSSDIITINPIASLSEMSVTSDTSQRRRDIEEELDSLMKSLRLIEKQIRANKDELWGKHLKSAHMVLENTVRDLVHQRSLCMIEQEQQVGLDIF